MTCENHARNTRFANNMNVVISNPNVETFRNSFTYQGFTTWNSLPPYTKNASIVCTHIVLLYNRTTDNSLAELYFISCINMFK